MSDDLPKRQRRERVQQQENQQQESDQFWKNNPYFDGVSDEDEQSYVPKQESASVSDEDDFVDSLAIDDENDWKDMSEQVQPQSQQSHSLLRANLKLYTTMRGIHSRIDLSTVNRIEQTSYIEYDDGYTYQSNPVLNRKYLGLPLPAHGHDEQLTTKTEYHQELFRLEDKRYFIDIELLQLRRLKKLTEKINLKGFLAYRGMTEDNQTIALEDQINNRISRLQADRKALEADATKEALLFRLAIDQRYYLQQQQLATQYTPKYIQELFNKSKIEDEQLLNQYQIQKERFPNLIAPSLILSFPNRSALQHTEILLQKSIEIVHNTYQNRWLLTLFQDMYTCLFDLESIEMKQSGLTIKEIDSLLKEEPRHQISEDFTLQHIQVEDEKQLFYPNYRPMKYTLFGRPVVVYCLMLLHQIYEEIGNVISIINEISYLDKIYKFSDLIIELIFRALNDELSDAQLTTVLKRFKINSQILYMIVQWRRLFYQFDQLTVELLLSWIGTLIGPDSKQIIPEVQGQLQQKVEEVLSHINQEIPECKLVRVQNVERTLYIHQFEIAKLSL